MLKTFPNIFTAKNLRKQIENERDKEVNLRYRIYMKVTENRKSRETYVALRTDYPTYMISDIRDELQERGFRVTNYVDLSKDKEEKGLKISY